MRQRPVDDAIVFQLRDQTVDDLIAEVDRALSRRPAARVLMTAMSSHATVVAEVISIIRHGEPRTPVTHLTARETEVLAHIRRGHTNREIATQLGVSLSTINKHVENMLEKLPARNRAQAVAEAASYDDPARIKGTQAEHLT